MTQSKSASRAKTLPQAEGAQLIALFNAGRYGDLESRALKLSKQYPASGFVWKVLGTALLVQGKNGLQALKQAVALLPDDVEAWSNLGNVQKAQGLLDAAVQSYRRAVALKPGYVAGHFNLGIALKEAGQAQEAVEAYRQALALQPAFAEAHYNLGLALADLGELDGAQASYRAALQHNPYYAEAMCNLGAVLGKQGLYDEAVTMIQCALTFKPDFAEAYNNLGNVLAEAQRHEQALDCYRKAQALQPDAADTCYAQGKVLTALRRYDEARDVLMQALSIQPDAAEAYLDLGNVQKELGHLEAALGHYREAIRIEPDNPAALGALLMTSNYVPGVTAESLLAQSRSYGEVVARLAQPYSSRPNARDGHKVLRVGLVSGDLRQHPVGYFLDSVLQALVASSEGRLQLHGYATQPVEDALTARIKACCQGGWRMVMGLSDEALAERIRADGIDILIDLSGHTAHNRLSMFAWKPAPVQVSWLGYFATTGVVAIDYFIGDPWTVPAALEAHFSERIWRLPETRLCFTVPEVDVAVTALPALQNGYITFGCFNNLTKMNDEVVALWSQVLQAVAGSKLMLKATQLGNEQVAQAVKARFAAQGIEAERLVLEGASPRADYLAAYGQVDISLDPFPFTGGTTSAEGLWMGVPVLTLAGDSVISRQGVGLAMNAGLADWVARDAADYVAKAVAHAADTAALAGLRAGLRERVLASPLFDATRFARHFEAALRGMWQHWCEAD